MSKIINADRWDIEETKYKLVNKVTKEKICYDIELEKFVLIDGEPFDMLYTTFTNEEIKNIVGFDINKFEKIESDGI